MVQLRDAEDLQPRAECDDPGCEGYERLMEGTGGHESCAEDTPGQSRTAGRLGQAAVLDASSTPLPHQCRTANGSHTPCQPEQSNECTAQAHTTVAARSRVGSNDAWVAFPDGQPAAGRGVRAAPCKAVRVTPPEHVDTDAADMALTPERRAVIVGAMQRVSLKYVPVWALHVPEERWVKTVIQAKARE